MTLVCSKCGGTDISEGHIAMYDPNNRRDDRPVSGGLDFPLEYNWCADCNTEHIDFINEDEYDEDD